MTSWELHGQELNNCNCDSGCPCQFMSPPTYGSCEFIAAFRFDSGHFGDVDLGGTVAAMLVQFPGPIHEGNGTLQIVIDEGVSEAQRDALQSIMTGKETKELATVFWVLSAMSPHKLQTLYRPIDLEMDMEKRIGRCVIPGLFETKVEPLRNPVTGDPHRARIDLPDGFEFRIAEIAMGTTKPGGDTGMSGIKDKHAYITEIHMSNEGVLDAA
jgi:hypothetical protein